MIRHFILAIDDPDAMFDDPVKLHGWLDGMGFEDTSGCEIIGVVTVAVVDTDQAQGGEVAN